MAVVADVLARFTGDSSGVEAAANRSVAAIGKVESAAAKSQTALARTGATPGFDKLANQLRATSQQAGKTGTAITGALKGAEVQASKTATVLASIGKGLIAGFAIGKIIQFAGEVSRTGEELLNLSNKTKISVETLSALKNLAETNESSLSDLATGVLFLQRNLANVADDEGKAAIQALAKLGISAQEATARSQDMAKFLEFLAGRLNLVTSENERTEISMALMGRGADSLRLTMRELGEKGLDVVVQKAREMGLVMSREQAQALDAAGDRLTTLKQQLIVAAAAWTPMLEIAVAVIEKIGRLITWLGEKIQWLASLPFFGGTVGQAFQDIGKMIGLIDLSPIERLGKAEIKASESADILARRARVATVEIKRMTNAQILKQFVASGDKELQKLGTRLIEERQNIADLQKAMTPQGAVGGKGPPSKKQTDEYKQAIDSLTQSFQNQIAQNQLATIELMHGEDAALQAAQAVDILATRNKLAADKIPIKPEFAKIVGEAEALLKSLGFDVDALNERDLTKLQEQIRKTADELRAAKMEAVSLQSVTDLLAIRKEAGKVVTDLEKDMTREMMTEGQRRMAQIEEEKTQRIKAVEDWRQAAIAAEESRAAKTGESRDAAIAAINAEADRIKQIAERAFTFKTDPMVGLAKELEEIDRQAAVLGGSFDATQAKINATTEALQRLAEQKISPLDERVLKLKDDLANLRLEQVAKEFEDIDKIGSVLGGTFDTTGAKISAVENAIQDLIKSGVPVLDQRIQDLKATLEDLRMAEIFEDAFDKMFDVISEFDGDFKKLGQNIHKILSDITKDILKTQLKDWLKDIIMPKIKLPGGVKLPGQDKTGVPTLQTAGNTLNTAGDKLILAADKLLSGGTTQQGMAQSMFGREMPPIGTWTEEIPEFPADEIFGGLTALAEPTTEIFGDLTNQVGDQISSIDTLMESMSEFDTSILDAALSTDNFSSMLGSLFGMGGGGAAGGGGLFDMFGSFMGMGGGSAAGGGEMMDLLGLGSETASIMGGTEMFDLFSLFAFHKGAVRLHGGALRSNEIRAILERGEAVIPRKEAEALRSGRMPEDGGIFDQLTKRFHDGTSMASDLNVETARPVFSEPGFQPPTDTGRDSASGKPSFVMNVSTPDANSFHQSRGQISADMHRAMATAYRRRGMR